MKKWLKRAAIGVAVSILITVAGFVFDWYWTRSAGIERRNTAVAKLDAEDAHWRAADLCAARNAALPPPDRNAAEVAIRAVDLAPKALTDYRAGEEWREATQPNHLPNAADLRPLIAVHDQCGEALNLARSVRLMTGGGFRLDFAEPNSLATLLPYTQKIRQTGMLLDIDAVVRAYQGRPNEAIESAHALLNTGRALGDEPTFISQLVRMAVVTISKKATERTLGWGKPTAGLAELQAAYADELAAPRITYGLRGERASLFSLMQNLDDGKLGLSGLVDDKVGSGLRDRATTLFGRKFISGQQATLLEIFGQLLAADKLSGPERDAAFEAVPIPPKDFENFLIRLLLPAWHKMNAAENRTRAVLGSTVVALACERYRLKFGKWPATLADIPKEILREVPADPYTGEALLYKILPDGAVVYATGPDRIDNGGTSLTDKMNVILGTDIGFRLWNPDQRGLPPLPKPASDDGALPPPGFPPGGRP
ncbi:hypothetical protein [Fimbriiglobus ruber]|uniref:Uncharacterized protein n=1 Tax=Fimbriiglobus ruber TaxID=1908690 RepID=A0A225CZK0_9BACT|nr:hypothetical protein [Fimbriiglobus ruber]OWK34790.1 hypothetical protein FRUB_09632 [Fimbriiglobus ruber]